MIMSRVSKIVSVKGDGLRLLGAVLLLTLSIVVPVRAELPPPTPNMELIPSGSLIIAMDNDKQNIGAVFNLKAYGLANRLLWEGVRLSWAIRAGKAKDGIDFTVAAQRILPSAIGPATLDFRGGPFIIHRDRAAFALPLITAFGNNVAVYETTADVMVDVRFTLDQKKRVGVLNDGGNSAIHTAVLDEAGFVAVLQYAVIPAATLLTVNASACITLVSEPHWKTTTNDTEADAIRQFAESGGNFLAQCAAIESYENNTTYGLFQTTLGVVENNLGNASHVYANPDLAYSQFQGALSDEGGSVTDYELAAGSVFQNGAHSHAHNATDPDLYIATVSKLAGGDGSNVLYLGGHNYNGTDLGNMNGKRMYMNAAMMPSDRPGSCSFDVPVTPGTDDEISGTVYEDINGDSNLADAVGVGGVFIRLYRDRNGNGVVDGPDIYVTATATDMNGDYTLSFVSSGSQKYLVAIDSATVPPSAGYNGNSGLADVRPEQTYGDDPATAALDLGSRFGGVDGATADNVDQLSTTPADNVYEHLARVDLSGGDVAGVDFAFSFNVVVNVNIAGQGSLEQFINHADAILGANAMRFVPAVATNAFGGGGNWWSISPAVALPEIKDALTTVDGTAYSSANGTTVRNDNATSNGVGGTVGVDSLPLTRLDPELELVGASALKTGIKIKAANVTVRGLAIYGFGDTAGDKNEANIRIGDSTGALIELNVLGANAGSFADPGSGAFGDNIHIDKGDSGTIRNNLIGFSGGNGIGMAPGNTTDSWLIQGNEIRGNGTNKAESSGVIMENSTGSTVRGNLLIDNKGQGVDTKGGPGGHTIENNEITGNGVGNLETAGVRLHGTSNAVSRNEIHANFGAAVMVDIGSTLNVISQNSMYDNGEIGGDGGAAATAQIGIDLLELGNDANKGSAPFVTLNDNGDGDGDANGLLNYPILETATIVGSNLVLTGLARPGSVIELFIADADPSGFGEGQTY
ncbi:MAG: right-handed parallel beta-helix repeat-containing protein, partial [Alphaproteobacteria bacterium]